MIGSDWISLDDAEAIELYIADRAAEAREIVGKALDDEGIRGARRAAMIAHAVAETERITREAIQVYRTNCAESAPQPLH